MACHGQYVKTTSFDFLPNRRCKLKAKPRYRNDWCENDGDCKTCSFAKQCKEAEE